MFRNIGTRNGPIWKKIINLFFKTPHVIPNFLIRNILRLFFDTNPTLTNISINTLLNFLSKTSTFIKFFNIDHLPSTFLLHFQSAKNVQTILFAFTRIQCHLGTIFRDYGIVRWFIFVISLVKSMCLIFLFHRLSMQKIPIIMLRFYTILWHFIIVLRAHGVGS